MSMVLDQTTPVARKPHQCDDCYRTIQPGETYRRQRNVGDDGVYSWKSCAHCRAFYGLVDLWDWAGQPDEGIGPDTMCDYEPANISEARWLVHWKRRWARRDGALYPVPALATSPEEGADV